MGGSLNAIQNNPERNDTATPPRPVSGAPGLACVPRMGRVSGASMPGASLSREQMPRGWKSASVACGMAARLVGLPAGALFAGALSTAVPAASLCDEYNPLAPARTGEIRLDVTDFADEDGTEIQSFVETE